MSVVNSNESISPRKVFLQEKNPLSLVPLLKLRLPNSCCLLNQLTVYEPFKDDFEAFTFRDSSCATNNENENSTEESLWIIFCFKREDWCKVVSISSPKHIQSESLQLSNNVKYALEQSQILNWDEPFVLLNLDLNVSDFLIQHNIRKLGNVVKIFPCYLFYLEPQEVLQYEEPTRSDVTVGPIDLEKVIPFFKSFWDFYKPESETFFRKAIPNCVSSAVYLKNGIIVCAGFAAPYGNICTLVTHPEFRRKGYATLAMRYLFKEMAKKGLHPVWETYITNYCGLGLHMSLNPRIVAKVDYICHKAL